MSKYAVLFGPAALAHDMNDYKLLFNYNKFVKEKFDLISNYTNIPINVLFKEEINQTSYSNFQITKFAIFAGMAGIAENIRDIEKKNPIVSGGVSLGDLNAAVFSSAVNVENALEILKYKVEDESDKEAIGLIYSIENSDCEFIKEYKNVSIGVDFGQVKKNKKRIFMISGLRSDLEIIALNPKIEINILPPTMCRAALHSKFRYPIAEKIKCYLETIQVNDPFFPLAGSGNYLKTIRTKENIIENIIKSEFETIYLNKIIENIQSFDIDRVYCVGPFLRDLEINFKENIRVEFYDDKNFLKFI